MNTGYRVLGFSLAVLVGAMAGCATSRPVEVVAEAGEVGEVAIDADPPGKPRGGGRSPQTAAYRQCVGLATEDCHRRYADSDQALACYHSKLEDCRRQPGGPTSASN